MRRPKHLLALVIGCCLFIGCREPKIEFTGSIVNEQGARIADAEVYVSAVTDGKAKALSLRSGKLGAVAQEIPKAQKYVVTITKDGYGTLSKVFRGRLPDYQYILRRGTRTTLQAREALRVIDIVQKCSGGVDSVREFSSPAAMVPFVYDVTGRLIAFKIPKELRGVYNKIARRVCVSNVKVTAPPESFESKEGPVPPDEEIAVTVTTVNPLITDAMPGDYSVEPLENNRERFMITMGAATVDAYYKGERLKLKKGAMATISIPVNPAIVESMKELPQTIPFWSYDRDLGWWKQEGEAKLDPETRSYVKEVSHFSEFNLDLVPAAGSCVQVNYSGGRSANDILTVITEDNTGMMVANNLPFTNSFGADCVYSSGPNMGNADNGRVVISRLIVDKPVGIIYYEDSPRRYISNKIIYTKSLTSNSGIAGFTDCNMIEASCVPAGASPLDIGENDSGMPNLEIDDAQRNPVLIVSSIDDAVAGNKVTIAGNNVELSFAVAFDNATNNKYELVFALYNTANANYDPYQFSGLALTNVYDAGGIVIKKASIPSLTVLSAALADVTKFELKFMLVTVEDTAATTACTIDNTFLSAINPNAADPSSPISQARSDRHTVACDSDLGSSHYNVQLSAPIYLNY